jgi:CheY-like chemotaxis protein
VRLLLVSDDKAFVEATKKAFKPLGEQVQLLTTPSGVEAVLLITEQKPHGVLLDFGLADFDCLELVRRVRSRKTLDGVKLIAISARGGDTEGAVKAGAATVLSRPVTAEQVLELFRVPMSLSGRTSR